MNILLIDDDSGLRKSIRIALETMNHKVTEARSGPEAVELLGHRMFDVAFLDIRLGQESGLDLLPELLRLAPNQAIVVITAYATIDIAVDAMRRGATDFLPKPFTPAEIRIVLDRVSRLRKLQSHVDDLEERLKSVFPEMDLDTDEPAMRQALDVAFRAAPTEATILLRGESGTGKGVVARAIHAAQSALVRAFRHGPLPQSVCGAIGKRVVRACSWSIHRRRSGYAGKSFRCRIGNFVSGRNWRSAVGVTAEAAAAAAGQTVRACGRNSNTVCDVRIIAATNRDLQAAVAAGTFREDLLYRLNVFELFLPPLRQRRNDLENLMQHLLRIFARQNGKLISGFTQDAHEAMLKYPWPGNVRELRNAIERGVILATGPLVGLFELPAPIGLPPSQPIMEVGGAVTLEQLEAEHIRRILNSTSTLEEAAAILGIDPSTLYRKRKREGL